MLREAVHEAIGGGVVGLADIAQCRAGRREADQPVKFNVAARLVKVDQAGHLGRQHRLNLFGRLAQQ